MIDLYTGTPGSGKSLEAVALMRDWLRAGRPVISNFPLDISKLKLKKAAALSVMENDVIVPDFLTAYSKEFFRDHRVKEDSILLVLDEAQLLFNARTWNEVGRSDWIRFFTQHRKYGFHVILICQFDLMIDKQIRSLVEYEYKHRKASNFGFGGKALSLLRGGNMFFSVLYWYPMQEKIKAHTFSATKKVYAMYNTFDDFD